MKPNLWIKLGALAMLIGVIPAGSAADTRSSCSNTSKEHIVSVVDLTTQLIMLYENVDSYQPKKNIQIYGNSFNRFTSFIQDEFERISKRNICDDEKYQLKNSLNGCSNKVVNNVFISTSLDNDNIPSVIIIANIPSKKELENIKNYANKHKILTISYKAELSEDVALVIETDRLSVKAPYFVPPTKMIVTINIKESVKSGTLWDPSVLTQANLLTQR